MEILFAALAAIGLAALVWLVFGRLVAPVGRFRHSGCGLFAVLLARGDGGELEHAVTGLKWLQGKCLADFTILIADAGLDEDGQRVAAALMERDSFIRYCPLDAVGAHIRASVPREM